MAISIGYPGTRRLHLSGFGAAVAFVALVGATAGIAAVAMDGSGGKPAVTTTATGYSHGAGPETLTLLIVGSQEQKAQVVAAQMEARNILEAGTDSLQLAEYAVLVVPPDAEQQDLLAVSDAEQIARDSGAVVTLVDLR